VPLRQVGGNRHLGDGLRHGAHAIGMGVFDGVTGLVTKPMDRIREEGLAAGLVHGVAQGKSAVFGSSD
jgi:hypothetical protein